MILGTFATCMCIYIYIIGLILGTFANCMCIYIYIYIYIL